MEVGKQLKICYNYLTIYPDISKEKYMEFVYEKFMLKEKEKEQQVKSEASLVENEIKSTTPENKEKSKKTQTPENNLKKETRKKKTSEECEEEGEKKTFLKKTKEYQDLMVKIDKLQKEIDSLKYQEILNKMKEVTKMYRKAIRKEKVEGLDEKYLIRHTLIYEKGQESKVPKGILFEDQSFLIF